jgi:hypothetical protein
MSDDTGTPTVGLIDDRILYSNLIARARLQAQELAASLVRLERAATKGDYTPAIDRRLVEMAQIYRHLSRVRVDSEMIGVEEP